MRNFILAAALLPLSGCAVAAAPLIATAAGYAVMGYGMYSVGNVKDAKYDVAKVDPLPDAHAEIRRAGTVAIFPTNSEVDGAVVDIFDEHSGLTTISSRRTIEIIERSGVDQQKLLSYPSRDRAEEIRRFGQLAGSDIVVFAVISQMQAKGGMLMFGGGGSKITVNSKTYSAKTGEMLLQEAHTITLDLGDTPTNTELAQLAAMGIADRLYELRTGINRAAWTLPPPPNGVSAQTVVLD
ncbi:MAG: hypothetical protein AAFO77_08190 [Pseudomonadota bacterium]